MNKVELRINRVGIERARPVPIYLYTFLTNGHEVISLYQELSFSFHLDSSRAIGVAKWACQCSTETDSVQVRRSMGMQPTN